MNASAMPNDDLSTSGHDSPFSFNLTAYREGGEHIAIAEICRQAGANGVEFWPWAVEEHTTPAEVKRIAGVYANAGVSVDTYHLPFHPGWNASHPCESTRRKAVNAHIARIKQCSDLGLRAVVLHPDGAGSFDTLEDSEKSICHLTKSLETLLPAAEAAGLDIALENMPPAQNGNRLSAYPLYLARIAASINHPRMGFCLDTGHACMAGGLDGATEWFDALGSRIIACHLHDNDAEQDLHLAPGQGLFNWTAFFRRAMRLGYTHRMTIEAPPYAPGPPYPIAAWTALVTETMRLAATATAPPALAHTAYK